MRDYESDDVGYDYGPNELVQLEKNNPELYRSIVRQNIDENTTVEQWEKNNLRYMQNLKKK
jgi:hypothetical protein